MNIYNEYLTFMAFVMSGLDQNLSDDHYENFMNYTVQRTAMSGNVGCHACKKVRNYARICLGTEFHSRLSRSKI